MEAALKTVGFSDTIYCHECTKKLAVDDTYGQYLGTESDQPILVNICECCQKDWKLVIRAELRRGPEAVVCYGSLRERITFLDDKHRFMGTEEQVMARRWIRPETFSPPVTQDLVVSAKQVNAPANGVEVPILPVREWSIHDLFSSFERMIVSAPPRFEVITIDRSPIFRELCRRKPLKEIFDYLQCHGKTVSDHTRYGWGFLMLRLQLCLDSQNKSAPEDCNDLEGWITWLESMIEKTDRAVVTA